jgi:hypothetical protein
MNVFEDLVEELKEENLLEETIINTISAEKRKKQEAVLQEQPQAELPQNEAEIAAGAPVLPETETDQGEIAEAESAANPAEAAEIAAPTPPVDEMEYYRRRAMDEVTSLQLVEHVFSGVERDQMKILPKQFDDIAVKKALHDFLQISKEASPGDSAQAEFKLMQETESWCSALSYRDKNISVSDLRRYCETTKPVLSAHALLALARFYRNLPHTEAVRNKFEMVLTRLFVAEAERNRRELMFTRDEIIKFISEYYAEWASIPIYSEADETELLLVTVKFDDFMAEAQGADSFDELVKSDFYNRLRLFKESVGDKFYAPQVLASAIECNVHVGNRYVELLEKARQIESPEQIQVKYGFLLDQVVSDATGKTLQLAELLTERPEEPEPLDEPKERLIIPSGEKAAVKKAKASAGGFFGVSKWLILLLFGTIFLTVGLYIYVEHGSTTPVSPEVQKVNLENSSFKDYLQTARINQELLIGVVNDNWNNASEEKKQEILGKLINAGKEKGFKKVHLLNREGLTVGFASETEIVVTKDSQL